MKRFCFLLLSLFLYAGPNSQIFAEICFDGCESGLMHDLLIVDFWNKKVNDRLPVTYNHFLMGGYLNMPSARMGQVGELGFGYSSVPPYRIYNIRAQLIDHLETSGNYRIFTGIEDKLLSQHGFGDFSDKGANFKIAVLHPEDSDYKLPGLAFGMDDFLGTRSFKSQYIVLTQVFLERNFEASLGYGWERYKGFFGGVSWMPWRNSCNAFIKGVSLVAEYDASDYKNPEVEKHPGGRNQKTPFNIGVKYRLWDYFDFSTSLVRGNSFAFSASTFYNFGETEGFLPKIDDVLLYTAPMNTQEIGWLRPGEVLAQDFLYACKDQGFELLESSLSVDECQKRILRLKVFNWKYRLECEVRERLNAVLSLLSPTNIDLVIVVIEADGFPIQEYHYNREFLEYFCDQEICELELDLATRLCEVTYDDPCRTQVIFECPRESYNLLVLPKTHTLFGSSRGKFKYALGFNVGSDGYIFDDLYYSVLLGYTACSDLHDVSDVDMLNPSQLINVRTDVINYYKQEGITFDQAYLQKNWNMGNGWFSRLTGGYVEQEYGGFATQFLYYPVNSCWAVGFEASVLGKRKERGLWFTNKIRKLDGFKPTYRKFLGYQYYLDLYYDYEPLNLDFEISVGKFMANDAGARFIVSRYFPSGMRFSVWYTLTNARDQINGSTYHDKGFELSMPLDIFFTHSSRSKWGYGMSAWLRDCGYRCTTGEDLFYMINDLRQ